ncbi:MAG: class I SAM-dependent methyltransferase [Magnetococcales bacterium]|nr:class I SAM-dependent methyltransferase [Magnetococcales bacterium]
MSMIQGIVRLEKHGKVYLSKGRSESNPAWIKFQEREKAFWKHKITQTPYDPDPVKNFRAFLDHWGIEPSFFKDKATLEIGSGPFGFFSAIARMDPHALPDELVVMDPLMDFYQQFTISNHIPQHAVRLQAVGENIPIPDQSCDLVVTTNTIDHVEDCHVFLGEIRRVLKDGGVLLFSVHTVSGFAGPIIPLIKLFDKNHPHHFRPHDVHALLKENGFDIKTSASVPIYKEDGIPEELGMIKKSMYFIAYRLMSAFYGFAKKRISES